MTVEELLFLAVTLIRIASENALNDQFQAAQLAATTAHAAAATAQAMMLAQMTTAGSNFGQTIRWLREDTGN